MLIESHPFVFSFIYTGPRTRGGSNGANISFIRESHDNESSDQLINVSANDLNVDVTQITAQQPDQSKQDKWSNHPPALQKFVFNETEGMKIDIPQDADPMFFFQLLFTDEFVEQIVKTTNEYTKAVIASDRPTRDYP